MTFNPAVFEAGDNGMKVLFFAQSRLAAGRSEYELPTRADLSQEEFWRMLIDSFPDLAPHRKTARLARRETYLSVGESIRPGDEIAVLPPVSGG